MSKSLTLCALVLLLGLASVGAWFFARGGLAADPARAPMPADGTRAPHDARLSGDGTTGERAPSSVDDRGAQPSADSRSRVVALALDELDAPIAGATLAVVAGAAPVSATSADDGSIELALDVRGDSGADIPWVTLRLSHADSVPLLVGARVTRGGATHLGVLRLVRGGALAGTVVDAAGRGLADVDVLLQTTPDGALPFPMPRETGRPSGSQLLERVDRDVARTLTDAEGRFRFAGLAAGIVRVWAATPLSLASFGDSLVVRPGQPIACAPIRLDDPPAEATVEGVVLAPDDAPVPGAHVVQRELIGEHLAGVYSDAQGRFRIQVERDTPTDLHAADPRGRFGWTDAPQVPAGARGLRLRLTPRRVLAITVVDSAGSTIEGARAVAGALDRFARLAVVQATDAKPGPLELSLPAEPFAVDVTAPGFLPRSLGPFEPASAPATVRCELDAAPAIHGRVVSAKGPIAGATVEVLQMLADGRARRLEPANARPRPLESRVDHTLRSGRTWASGEFRLDALGDADDRAHAWLRAVAPGFAPRTLRAVPSGEEELVVELDAGGSIAGHVRVGGESGAAGLIVAATNGDGLVRTARTGTDGAFLVERLEPGGYQVAVIEAEREDFADAFAAPDAVPSREHSDCEVRAGAVTRFDVELAASAAFVLAGRLQVDDWSMEGWTMRWRDGTADGARSRPVALAADGTFELRLRDARSVEIELRGRDPLGNEIVVQDEVELAPGRNTWSETLRTGTLSGRVADPQALWPNKRLACVYSGTGTAVAAVLLEFDRFNGLLPARVPAGSGRIVRMKRADEIDLGGDWPTACTYAIEAAGKLDLVIP